MRLEKFAWSTEMAMNGHRMNVNRLDVVGNSWLIVLCHHAIIKVCVCTKQLGMYFKSLMSELDICSSSSRSSSSSSSSRRRSVGYCCLHAPSPFSITHRKSWYLFYQPSHGTRLSLPRRCQCASGVQLVTKVVYCSVFLRKTCNCPLGFDAVNSCTYARLVRRVTSRPALQPTNWQYCKKWQQC